MSALVAIEEALNQQRKHFADVLPADLPVTRLIRTVVVSCQRTPKLLECSRESIMNAAMSAAVLGLEVDGVTGQAFLVPYGTRAQLIIGYKGYNTLAARAGITITASVVREADEFEWEKGTSPFVRHRPSLKDFGSRIVAAYAIAAAPDRAPVVEVLGIDEIMAVRDRSPAARKPDSPWNDPKVGFPAMAEKTVRRRLARSLPIGKLQLAAALDDAADMGRPAWIAPDGAVVTEADSVDVQAVEDPQPVLPPVEYVIEKPDGSGVLKYTNIHEWAEVWRNGIMRRQTAGDANGIRLALAANRQHLERLRHHHKGIVDEVCALATLAIEQIEKGA